SLFETGLGWLANHFASYRISGTPPVRHRTGSTRLVVFEGFETKNGPVIIAAANDRLFAKLAVALGRPEWATDPRFGTNALRLRHKAALIPEIQTIMLTRTKGEWVDLLDEAGVPCAPVHTFLEVLAHPQTAATGMIQKVPGLDLELMGCRSRSTASGRRSGGVRRGSASTTARSAETGRREDHRRDAHALRLARHPADAVRAAHGPFRRREPARSRHREHRRGGRGPRVPRLGDARRAPGWSLADP